MTSSTTKKVRLSQDCIAVFLYKKTNSDQLGFLCSTIFHQNSVGIYNLFDSKVDTIYYAKKRKTTLHLFEEEARFICHPKVLVIKSSCQFLTGILHRGVRNDFFSRHIYFFHFLFLRFFPFSLLFFFFLFSSDFYFLFLFGLFFLFSIRFLFHFQFYSGLGFFQVF